jgi:hypothetical protein
VFVLIRATFSHQLQISDTLLSGELAGHLPESHCVDGNECHLIATQLVRNEPEILRDLR